MEPSVSVRFAGDGEGDAPLERKEGVLRQLKYFTQVMDGEFSEGQERQVCIEKISRPIGEVVLQQEVDIVKSLTKDNLLDAMTALDYLQFDVDRIFTTGSSQSILWRIHRKVVGEGWLADHQLATGLLDGFSRYPFMARFIHCHPDICAALRQCLRKKPDVISEQWSRREMGEDTDATKAALSLAASLADAISYDAIDVSRQELARFMKSVKNTASLSTAHAAVFESDEFSLPSTATVRPFAGEHEGPITCMGFRFNVVGLPPPYAPCAPNNLPANVIRDSDAKLTDLAGWHVNFPRVVCGADRESFVSCYAADCYLQVAGPYGNSDTTRPMVRLHESPTLSCNAIRMGEEASAGVSVGPFGLSLLGGSLWLCGNVPILSADALAQEGLGDTRLRDIQLKVTARRFPMRELALHYLRMCVIEGRCEEISMMARSIHREVAEYLLTSMGGVGGVGRHRLPLMLYWAAAIEGLSRHRAEAIQTAFKDTVKKAVDAHDEEAFDQLYDQLTTCSKKEAAERHRLAAENERLRNENALLKKQECRGTKRPRDEMEGQPQQQRQQEGEADQEMKS
ncbi:unnamed protein product [Vitrella brassicaformis CCMP3155]|uniref:Uncharacterized protein n=1 Tax=Vitrella brassicaformis (strain CCMP3155) TaxID=1169540 RepID=A0A0G4FXV0_VITBC|nr:unnamed protein product [Vitrella brassicaformis CCMP3155]|eukprot:CEM20255.1 unnamed protein product [Vitrella brassicaformis CCMP3155]